MMKMQKTHKRKIYSVASVFDRQFKQNRDTSTATVVQIFSDSNHLSQKKKTRYQGCDVEKSRCKTTQI